jgi:hypothetical protein
MMPWFQPIILWVALSLAILLIVATIDAIATFIKTVAPRLDPDR